MRLFRWITVLALVGIVPITGRAQSPTGVLFHAIGDLPGGPAVSSVRDATRVGSMIYAVGASAQNNQVLCTGPNVPGGCVNAFGQDTPILWSFDTTTSTGNLMALPAIVNNVVNGNSVVANAISTDGNYIASQARIANNNPQAAAVRVTRALLPFSSANLDLRGAPYNATAPSGAAAISADGAVLWGNNNAGRAQRYDTLNAAGNVTIPLLRGSDNRNNILAHDSSANGNVGAGMSYNSANPALSQAFRFSWNPATNTGALSGVPFSPNGGTWNRALDLSASGQFTLLTGDSAAAPLGEVMIHNAANNSLTELGTPASAFRTGGFAGMTDDASVVAASFFSNIGSNPGLAYIHNAHGWFQVNGILRRAGIDLRSQGWDVQQSMNITGLSGDGTLLFGTMPHNGNFEGFVMEFPAGYLANYNITAVPVADTSIVGAWTDPGDPNSGAVIFMKDGTYFQIANNIPANQTGTNGFERGFYTWDSATGIIQFDTIVDTNGDEGIGDSNDRAGITLAISGDTLTAVVAPGDTSTLVRLPTDLANFVGAWVAGDSTSPDSSRVFVFLGDGTYYMAEDNDQAANGFGGHDGMESGTFSIDPVTGLVTSTAVIDTNGDWGFSDPIGTVHAFLGPDGLSAIGGDETGMFPFYRVIDPNTVRPVLLDPLFATGVVGTPLSFSTTATFHPLSYGAANLPAGLSIDGGTGVISGTPTTPGNYGVTVSASNTLATGTGIVTITINPITCFAGFYRAADTDTTCTPAPAGSYVPADGATAALLCPAGTFSAMTGSTSCTVASAGTYVANAGSTSATACPTGLSSDAGAIACDDRTAPTIDAHANVAATTTNASGTTVTYTSPASHDTYEGNGTAACLPASGSNFAVGTTPVTCTASDAAGNSTSSSFNVVVTLITPANRAPVCSAARASVTSLWPVNHRWVAIKVLGVTDADNDALTLTITSIFQDEPTNAKGDGDTAIDGKGVGTSTAYVRAERAGHDGDDDDDDRGRANGNGRVYHIRFTASDGTASCTGEVTVSVPTSRNGSAIDGGALYDSTKVTPMSHHDGDKCDHDKGKNGHRKGDGCEHDRKKK